MEVIVDLAAKERIAFHMKRPDSMAVRSFSFKNRN